MAAAALNASTAAPSKPHIQQARRNMKRRDFIGGITLVRAVSFENDVLTLRTVDLLKGPDGDTFNRLSWARL
jgi:hypothetical protein